MSGICSSFAALSEMRKNLEHLLTQMLVCGKERRSTIARVNSIKWGNQILRPEIGFDLSQHRLLSLNIKYIIIESNYKVKRYAFNV